MSKLLVPNVKVLGGPLYKRQGGRETCREGPAPLMSTGGLDDVILKLSQTCFPWQVGGSAISLGSHAVPRIEEDINSLWRIQILPLLLGAPWFSMASSTLSSLPPFFLVPLLIFLSVSLMKTGPPPPPRLPPTRASASSCLCSA